MLPMALMYTVSCQNVQTKILLLSYAIINVEQVSMEFECDNESDFS